MALLTVPLFLAACEEPATEVTEAAKPAGQVVAVVDGQEITIHQINTELRRMGLRSEEEKDRATRRIIKELVDREIMAQQALKAGLDRKPSVLMELNRARSSVLAQAYVSDTIGQLAPPDEAAIKQFISENPGLFDSRRIYTFDQILLSESDYSDDFLPMVDEAATFDEVAEVLESSGIEFRRSVLVRRAEEFPAELLQRISGIQDGENVILKGSGQAAIMRLMKTETLPVSEEGAESAARRFLEMRASTDAAGDVRDRLRSEADIQFFGNFADLNSSFRSAAEEAKGDGGQDTKGTTQ